MSLIHISSDAYPLINPYTSNPNAKFALYYNAPYQITPTNVVKNKKLYLRSAIFNYGVLTLNESFNNNIIYISVGRKV
jgi:hypothetical protein